MGYTSKPAVYLLIPFLRINHIILILSKQDLFANKKGKPKLALRVLQENDYYRIGRVKLTIKFNSLGNAPSSSSTNLPKVKLNLSLYL